MLYKVTTAFTGCVNYAPQLKTGTQQC